MLACGKPDTSSAGRRRRALKSKRPVDSDSLTPCDRFDIINRRILAWHRLGKVPDHAYTMGLWQPHVFAAPMSHRPLPPPYSLSC
jgi:hypothetical protein